MCERTWNTYLHPSGKIFWAQRSTTYTLILKLSVFDCCCFLTRVRVRVWWWASLLTCFCHNFCLKSCGCEFLQKSDKGQYFYWSSQTCSRISRNCLLIRLWPCSKKLKNTFSTWHPNAFCPTALYWPSTAFYWPSTTKYQPLRSHTDPVPSCINWECCFGIRDFCTVYPGSSFWRNNRSSP